MIPIEISSATGRVSTALLRKSPFLRPRSRLILGQKTKIRSIFNAQSSSRYHRSPASLKTFGLPETTRKMLYQYRDQDQTQDQNKSERRVSGRSFHRDKRSCERFGDSSISL